MILVCELYKNYKKKPTHSYNYKQNTESEVAFSQDVCKMHKLNHQKEQANKAKIS